MHDPEWWCFFPAINVEFPWFQWFPCQSPSGDVDPGASALDPWNSAPMIASVDSGWNYLQTARYCMYMCVILCVCVCMNDYIYKLNDTTQQNCICFRSQHLRPFVCVLNWCSHSLHMYLMCANTQIKHKSWQSLSSSRFIKWMMNVYKPCLHCTMIANIIQAPSDNSSIHGEGWLVETGLKSPTLAALLKTRWSTVTRCPNWLTHHVSGISRGLPYASIGWENLNQLRREKNGSHNHCLFNVFKDINHPFQLIISNQMLSYHFR